MEEYMIDKKYIKIKDKEVIINKKSYELIAHSRTQGDAFLKNGNMYIELKNLFNNRIGSCKIEKITEKYLYNVMYVFFSQGSGRIYVDYGCYVCKNGTNDDYGITTCSKNIIEQDRWTVPNHPECSSFRNSCSLFEKRNDILIH